MAADGDLWHLGIAADTLNAARYARALLPADWGVCYATRRGKDPISDCAAAFIAANGISTRLPTRRIGRYAIRHKGQTLPKVIPSDNIRAGDSFKGALLAALIPMADLRARA